MLFSWWLVRRTTVWNAVFHVPGHCPNHWIIIVKGVLRICWGLLRNSSLPLNVALKCFGDSENETTEFFLLLRLFTEVTDPEWNYWLGTFTFLIWCYMLWTSTPTLTLPFGMVFIYFLLICLSHYQFWSLPGTHHAIQLYDFIFIFYIEKFSQKIFVLAKVNGRMIWNLANAGIFF